MHSTASDGVLPPGLVVQRAWEAGLDIIALTDHDTLDGLTEALEAGQRLGVRVICGCEFSVRVAWGEMHLLGYFLPPAHPAIERFLIDARQMRFDRARQMVESLQAWGVAISVDDVLAEAGDASIGRPHVARALVRLGKVPDVATAFDEFLGLGRRAYVEKVLPDLALVADLVHGAGGLVSAAHLRDRANRTTLSRLMLDGLDAVEVRHPRHPPEFTAMLDGLAGSLGLLRTGGTDWHGDERDPACHLGAWAVPVEWVMAMEARVASRESRVW
ncbi:MAG TPA: PHP domain-containing protein [Gemmatimonadales bacterium]